MLAFAILAVACLIWYALVGLAYVAWAMLLATQWAIQKLAAMSLTSARLARPPLVRVVGAGRAAVAWVGSARHDMAKDDATGDNPAMLTAKLVALVVGLFGVIVVGIWAFKWVGQQLAESAQ